MKPKVRTRDGLRMIVGSRTWKWWRRNRRRIIGRAYAHWIKAHQRLLSPRKRVVKWAMWGVRHSAAFDYTETLARSEWLTLKPGHLQLPSHKIDTDCSGFATLCYKWAGLPDPNGLDYKTLGYTGTLLQHARKIAATPQALPGDLMVYGPGTGEHVSVIVEAGTDPLTASHGSPGVHLLHVSQDGRTPQRVCRNL